MKQHGIKCCMFFTFDHAWKKPLQAYASTLNIQIRYLKHFHPIQQQLPSTQMDSGKIVDNLKDHIKEIGLIIAPQVIFLANYFYQKYQIISFAKKKAQLNPTSYRIGVFGKGSMNIDNNGLFSDIFFTFNTCLQFLPVLFFAHSVSPFLIENTP
jgi:hypothetical protein